MTHVRVEDIDVDREQYNPVTDMRVLNYDGSGEYNEDKSARLIVWRDAGDYDEYPIQHARWYPVGTLIPLS